MTAEEIFKTMQDLIAEQFAIDAEEITLDSSFVDDLLQIILAQSSSLPFTAEIPFL